MGEGARNTPVARQDEGGRTMRRLRPWNRFQTRILAWMLILSAGTSCIAGFIAFRREMRLAAASLQRRGELLTLGLARQCAWPLAAKDRREDLVLVLESMAKHLLEDPDVLAAGLFDRSARQLAYAAAGDGAVDPVVSKEGLAALHRPPARRVRSVRAGDALHLWQWIEAPQLGGAARRAPLGIAYVKLSLRPDSEQSRGALLSSLKASSLILLLGILLALYLSRRLSRPVLALVSGAEKLRAGELGYQLSIKRRDELGVLAHSFNRMSAQLHETVESLNHLNRHLEGEIGRQTEALRRSRDFIALLNVPLQLHKLLDTALDALIRYSKAKAGAVYLQQHGRLELAVSQGALARAFALNDREAEFIGEQAVKRKHAMLMHDQALSAPLMAEFPDAGAVLYEGVRFRARLEGAIVLVFEQAPATDVVVFIEQACSQLAIALANTRALGNAEHLTRELEQRNIALLQRRDQLQEMNRLKSEFLARVSHELRTPLNAILGYAELLADGIYGDVNAEQKQRLVGIEESATSLLELINQILDLSRVEAGRMVVRLADTDVVELVREVVELAAPLVRERPYELELLLPETAIWLPTDASKVRQVLVNLLSNAIKFTNDGSVKIGVERREDDVRIWVEDTGIGIERANLALIFDEFRQVDGSSTREHGGSGLGLAISRKLAALIGAKLEVRSAPGEGSTFSLLLPPSPIVEERPRSTEVLTEIAVKVNAHPTNEDELAP